jgi:transposase
MFAIDETGPKAAMTPTTASSTRGVPVVEAVPRNRGSALTIIGALALDGRGALMTILGSTTAKVLETYVEQVFLPELKPGDMVPIDNLGAHRSPRVRRLVEGVGARIWFAPRNSPEFDPIELAWAKLRRFVRLANPRFANAINLPRAFWANLIEGANHGGDSGSVGSVIEPGTTCHVVQ